MHALWQDLRLATRSYLKQPGFTATAVLILALGIGANTAIYTLVDAVALRPLPVAHTRDLYRLGDSLNCCVNSGLQETGGEQPAPEHIFDIGARRPTLMPFAQEVTALAIDQRRD